jgi:hypothetical protein
MTQIETSHAGITSSMKAMTGRFEGMVEATEKARQEAREDAKEDRAADLVVSTAVAAALQNQNDRKYRLLKQALGILATLVAASVGAGGIGAAMWDDAPAVEAPTAIEREATPTPTAQPVTLPQPSAPSLPVSPAPE